MTAHRERPVAEITDPNLNALVDELADAGSVDRIAAGDFETPLSVED